MELESRALSAPRSVYGAQTISRRPKKDAKSEGDDMTSVSSASSGNDGVGHKRRSQSSAVAFAPRSKRRRRNEGDETVAVYNLPPNVNCEKFAGRIERWIAEIRGIEVEVVKCRSLSSDDERMTFFATFRDSGEARLAMSLNGIKFAKRTLFARIIDSDYLSIGKKGELCINYIFGDCGRRANGCRAAHGVGNLRLYNDTVLDRSRCVYINELPKEIQSASLVEAVRDRYKSKKIDAYFTFFRHRIAKGDAFFEFANPSHAEMAPEILDGLWSIGVHSWKPEYQAVFVGSPGRDSSEDIHTERQIISDTSNHSPGRSNNDTDHVARTRPNNRSSHASNSFTSAGYAARSITPEEKVSSSFTKSETPPNINRSASTPDQNKSTPPSGKKVQQDETILNLKSTIISLREELLQAKTDAVTAKEKVNDLHWKHKELTQDHTYNLQKIETLEKDNTDLNTRLDEVKDDAKYYRDKWEGERSYSRDYRNMEEEVDRLRRENDSLRRQIPDSRREQEQSKKRIQELERRLGGATDRNDLYSRDLKSLREKVQQLESSNRSSPRDSSLELKLEEAMSRNERLVKALHEANEKVDQLDYANHNLRKEKEAMTEELDQLRSKNHHAAAKTGSTRGIKVKSEPLT